MTAKEKSKEKDIPLTQYMISETGNGQFVIEIPSDWKVTFGWVNPGASSRGGFDGKGHCVRVWEGTKLRAVFDNVTRFRDLSIPLARKISSETGNAEWKKDSKGNFELSETKQLEEAYEAEDVEEVTFSK